MAYRIVSLEFKTANSNRRFLTALIVIRKKLI